MTPKEREAMQQALIYLDAIINGEGVKPYQLEGTAFTLREVLAEQAEQEPVAWVDEDGFPWKYNLDGKDWVPLYAAPVRTKDLTDDEIWKLYGITGLGKGMALRFARAVIAADREKNRG